MGGDSTSGQINLRLIFMSNLRNKLWKQLMLGPLKGWDLSLVTRLVDEAMNANIGNINDYLIGHEVMLLNMNEHLDVVINDILLPYLNQKRVQ
jgi:hypothetical protein